jgi:uncharacterized membrane protein YidH (DUF202 family)
MKLTGIALIVVGILMMAYTGFNFTTTEKVVDLGSVKINKEKEHTVQWPPVVGLVLVVGGVVVLASGARARS